jgi:formate hydrogenlyase subunit 3/multisubunit Na+/H+ antiporter MnhD subunit
VRRDAAAVTLAILVATGLTLAIADARAAVLAATGGGVVVALLVLVQGSAGNDPAAAIRVVRAAVIAGVMAIAATAWIGRDLSELAAQPVVFGLAYLTFALAVAIRFGAIPFHGWAARLTDTVPESTLPLVTAWGPAALAIVCLAWADASIAPLLLDLDQVRLVVISVGIASIVLSAVAALIQDDIEHIVGYSIIGDAGVVMLAIAALDPETWAPARTWILVMTRTAFAAWAGAVETTFGTGRMAHLGGWAIRSPMLAMAFGLMVVASVGIPGLAAFDAKATVIDVALDPPFAAIVLLATFAPLAYYGRLVVIGVGRPDPARPAPTGLRPTFDRPDLTDLPRWISRTWSADRVVAAGAVTLLLSVLALIVAAGGFGVVEAAAGLPPPVDGVVESFAPESVAPESFAPESVAPESFAPAGS